MLNYRRRVMALEGVFCGIRLNNMTMTTTDWNLECTLWLQQMEYLTKENTKQQVTKQDFGCPRYNSGQWIQSHNSSSWQGDAGQLILTSHHKDADTKEIQSEMHMTDISMHWSHITEFSHRSVQLAMACNGHILIEMKSRASKTGIHCNTCTYQNVEEDRNNRFWCHQWWTDIIVLWVKPVQLHTLHTSYTPVTNPSWTPHIR